MIKIICVGKLKEDYLKSGVSDYVRRISKYHKINVIEVSDSDIDNEEKEIIKHIDSRDYVISLCIEGEMLSSLELSRKIGYSTITFVIGGSYGISSRIKERSNMRLSFSKMTFPHGLFRIMLLEQIYRSFKINNNESYHK